jgi:hypothetical protein
MLDCSEPSLAVVIFSKDAIMIDAERQQRFSSQTAVNHCSVERA